MSAVNDPKSTDNQSVSPIRNLFRNNENAYNENGEQEEKEESEDNETTENEENTSETDNRLKGRLKKMKSSLNKIISVMSQPIEYTSYDDEEEDTNNEITGNEQQKIKSDNNDIHTIAEQEVETSQQTKKDKNTPNEKEKEPEFVFDDIFADIDKVKSSNNEQPKMTVEKKVESEKTESKTEEKQQESKPESKKEEHPQQETLVEENSKSEKAESKAEKIQQESKSESEKIERKGQKSTDEENIIYQAPVEEKKESISAEQKTVETQKTEKKLPQQTTQKTINAHTDEKKTKPKPTSKPQNRSSPQEMTMERLWEELPEYNIFEDSEPIKKGDKKGNTYIEETISKLQEMSLEQSNSSNTVISFDSPQKTPVKKEPVKSETEDLPNDDEHEEQMLEDKDLTEGNNPAFTYHYSETVPFIVMAGKFTKTLRVEYEAVMVYRNSDTNQNSKAMISNKKDVLEVKPILQDKKSETNVPENEPLKQSEPPKTEVKNTSTVENQPSKTESLEEQKSKNEKRKKRKKPLPKFSFRDFIGSVNDYDPDDMDFDESKPKKQLDDYNEEKDAEEIKTEIGVNLRLVLTRTIILLATTVISIVTAIIGQFTPLFSESLRTGWLFYAIINFVLFAVSAITAKLPIVNGLMPLRHLKGNSDTAVAVASFAVAIQSITAIFTPHVFTNGTYHIYVPIVITALLFNSVGKLLIILRARDNFKFLIKPYPKYAGKIYTDEKNAEKMVSELPSKKAIIGYTKRSKFMSNFLQLSYAPDSSEELAAKAAPVTTVISLALGILYGILTSDFAGGATSFALTACIGIPMICLLALNIPMKILCKNVLNEGAMISGYDAVKQFCDTNVIMVDSSQLYPKGTVTLSGMKVFKQSKLNEAMQDGAAIMYAVNGTMSYVFENIVQCRKEMLPKVDSVVYEDGKGLLAWVNKQRVLMGNRELLESHNIKVPDRELENRYFKIGCDITYISVSGELIAMFILSYKADREIVNELRNLQENGVSFIIRTVDPNITKEKTAEKFGLFHRCITILPTGLGNICHEVTSGVEERSRAYLVTRGKLSSFAKAVSWCIKMKSTITLSRILQYLCVGFGLLIFTFISFVSGFDKLGNIEILLYLMFWAVATIAVSLIKK